MKLLKAFKVAKSGALGFVYKISSKKGGKLMGKHFWLFAHCCHRTTCTTKPLIGLKDTIMRQIFVTNKVLNSGALGVQ